MCQAYLALHAHLESAPPGTGEADISVTSLEEEFGAFGDEGKPAPERPQQEPSEASPTETEHTLQSRNECLGMALAAARGEVSGLVARCGELEAEAARMKLSLSMKEEELEARGNRDHQTVTCSP